MDVIESFNKAASAFGHEPLFAYPNGQVSTLSKSYIPLLVNYTHEDKAAKGLRKGKLANESKLPIQFSALEIVRDHKYVLLSGTTGSGKTTFAKHLSFKLATKGFFEPLPVFRNEDGSIENEFWEAPGLKPFYFSTHGPESLEVFIDETLKGFLNPSVKTEESHESSFLIILDSIETLGCKGPVLISRLLGLESQNLKLLLLGDTKVVKHWNLPSDVARHDVFPLLKAQRQQAINNFTQAPPLQVAIGSGAAAATPIYFALALGASRQGDRAEELLDSWLDAVIPDESLVDRLAAEAFHRIENKSSQGGNSYLCDSVKCTTPQLLSSKATQRLLAARHLVNLPAETAAAAFHKSPSQLEPVVRSLLFRLHHDGDPSVLIQKLMNGSETSANLGALLVSEFISETSNLRKQILAHMSAIIDSALPSAQKEKAGRILSRFGDPRDLTALAFVPEGDSMHGSESHVNSQPPHLISVKSFRIGIYPVVNRDYAVFIRETNRDWHSPDGFSPERQNVPATDLTWYDANAYCLWLTLRWQSSGKISSDEVVRLPTEPEWERAARGKHNPLADDGLVYPWGAEWQDESANYEESGFNSTCAVGLFPKGGSPYQVHDMGGNIWEWCTTLWGEDMTTPTFKYPWRNDGREDLGASGSIRRVLRGGCFSSNRLKITTTYRGSLEPGGSWRGNGFRIVVVRDG